MKYLPCASLALVLALSGCAGGGQGIQNFAVEINDKFEGTIKEALVQPVIFRWQAKPLSQSEKYILKLDLSQSIIKSIQEVEIPAINQGDSFSCFISNVCKLEVDGNDHTLTAFMEGENRMGLSIYWLFISAKSNSEIPISLTKETFDQELVSANIAWKRTPRTEKPQDPLLTYKWTFDSDGYAEYVVKDISRLTYDSFPDESIENCVGFCRNSGRVETLFFPSRQDVFSWNVKGVGKSIKVERQVGNENGKSGNVVLDLQSPENVCNQSLKIDELGDNEFACGILSVEVFQSDLNTGECRFLGNWNDKSENEKFGLFEYCGTFTAGSFKEGQTYTIAVIVGKPVDYKTRLGTNNRVLSFTITG